MKTLDQIELRGLEMNAVIGAYPSELTAGQRVILDVDLWLDTRAAVAGKIAKTVDYGRLIGELRFLMQACRFALLESAAEALCRYMLAPPTQDLQRAQVERVSVSIKKPNAYATLRITREASEYTFAIEEKPFGRVDVVYEGPSAGIYRLRIGAGKAIETHIHTTMDEQELVLGGGLLLQRQKVAAGTAIDWPKNFPHRYDNPTAIEQTVLCVDRPRFDQADERIVSESNLVMPQTTNVYPPEHAAPYG